MFIATDQDDIFTVSDGDQLIDGLGGFDTLRVQLSGVKSESLLVSESGGRYLISSSLGASYAFTNIEALSFSSTGPYVVSGPIPEGRVDASGLRIAGEFNKSVLDGIPTDDTYIGGSGNDTLYFGIGFDSLTGGGGADRFKSVDFFGRNDGGDKLAGNDVIADFSREDTIDFSQFERSETGSVPVFIGSNEFSGNPGEYRYYFLNGVTVIEFEQQEFANSGLGLKILNGMFDLWETELGSNILQTSGALPKGPSIQRLLGTVNNDVLVGDGGSQVVSGLSGNDIMTGGGGKDAFVFSLVGQPSTGRDRITDFGSDDVIVLDAPLRDVNGDGIIDFGRDKLLGTGGGGTVSITSEIGGRIRQLEFDGTVGEGFGRYYVYSIIGSVAGVADAIELLDGVNS